MCLRKLLPKSQHPLQTVIWLNTERNIKNLPAKAFAKVLNDKLVWILFSLWEKIFFAFDINLGSFTCIIQTHWYVAFCQNVVRFHI